MHKWGFPQCGGAVDCTHIPIISPSEYPADYFNRKGWHSIILQGTVDHLYRFTDVCIGWPGHVHDARVLGNSSLYHRGNAGTLFPDSKTMIAGVEVPIVVLGDPAYPLLPWIMKPYIDTSNLTCEQQRFNYRLSRARVVVEDAFGRLKQRWRCQLKRNDTDVLDLPVQVAACCVLHNIREMHSGCFSDNWLDEVNSSTYPSSTDNSNSTSDGSAENIWRALTTYFKNN